MKPNLDQYFNKQISTKEFAVQMRRFMYATTMINFKNEDNLYQQWLEDGYFQMTQFLETIEPILEES